MRAVKGVATLLFAAAHAGGHARAMRRRRFLTLLPVGGLLLAGCGPSTTAKVTVSERPTLEPEPPGPSPTSVPPPEVVLSAESAVQGGTILVSLVGEVKDGAVNAFGRRQVLTQGARSIYAFVGIATEDPRGDQVMTIEFTLTNGSTGTFDQRFAVEETEWTVDSVTISTQLASLLEPKAQADEVAQLNSVYSAVSTEKLWEEGWLSPTGGPITTRFGERRSYNGAPADGHHTGTDLGAPAGTPVGATNHGRVVLARQLRQRGNMVVVDHGGGLMSGYAHMASFAVAQGELVRAGDTLGFVGSTGLSTGAHLHWEMSAGGVLVDAARFADGSNGF